MMNGTENPGDFYSRARLSERVTFAALRSGIGEPCEQSITAVGFVFVSARCGAFRYIRVQIGTIWSIRQRPGFGFVLAIRVVNERRWSTCRDARTDLDPYYQGALRNTRDWRAARIEKTGFPIW